MSENEEKITNERGNHLDSSEAKPSDAVRDAISDSKSAVNGDACPVAQENPAASVDGEAETPAQKLPAKPSLKSSNSNHQLTKSNSQYRVHFPEQEVTKIVETEIIVVPSCTQRMFYQMFCCCSHPYKP